MDNSSIVEPIKQGETRPVSEKDRQPVRGAETEFDMIEKLLPKLCGELTDDCRVSVNFHVIMPPAHNVLKSKPKSASATVSDGN